MTTRAATPAVPPPSLTIAAALRAAVAALRQPGGVRSPGSDSPRLDAEILLAKVLQLPRSALIVRAEMPLSNAVHAEFTDLIARRASGTPVAYLTGEREFWSLPLAVTPDVLVPRPETELLVELALSLLPIAAPRRVLDLGTGSGAIALAIAIERPQAEITATDLSAAALTVAMQNARRFGASRVRWRLGSWFDALEAERFDLIVANPPYIAADDPALPTLASEPLSALSPGPTGLEAFTSIVGRAAAYLAAEGRILLEHGVSQAAALGALLERQGFLDIRSHDDASGRPRAVSATRPRDPPAT
jgi:release factor glutamine methyltransferase